VDVHGERRGLPAGLDLAAYRVVQEAVTNVIKHAATDRCTVTVDYQEDSLTLEIADGGGGGPDTGCSVGPRVPKSVRRGPPARLTDSTQGQGAGHGIAGMRERVGMYGGEFRAGPRPGHGFQVTARFPVRDAGT